MLKLYNKIIIIVNNIDFYNNNFIISFIYKLYFYIL